MFYKLSDNQRKYTALPDLYSHLLKDTYANLNGIIKLLWIWHFNWWLSVLAILTLGHTNPYTLKLLKVENVDFEDGLTICSISHAPRYDTDFYQVGAKVIAVLDFWNLPFDTGIHS